MFSKVSIANILSRVVLFVWAVVVLIPLLWIFLQSLKTNQEFFQSVWKFPATPMVSNYVKAWNNMGIGKSLFNTLYLVGSSLILGLLISTLNAYVFTRVIWKGRKFWLGVVMLSLLLPGINALVPQFVIMRNLHMTNSLTGMIILYSLGVNAFDLLILGGFMKTLPKELEESAFMDGATLFKIFKSIIVPLAIPGIVTVGIFKFIGLYNDFLGPFIFLGDPKKFTIGVNLYHANLLMQYKSDWTSLCAGIIITIIPILLVYIFFQKQIVAGATLGSVKG